MSVDDAFRSSVLALAPELVAAVRAELEQPKLIPIKAAPVAYRTILSAETAGELTVYRVGHASFVDEAELFAWIRRTGVRREEPAVEPVNEIGQLVQMNRQRRQRSA